MDNKQILEIYQEQRKSITKNLLRDPKYRVHIPNGSLQPKKRGECKESIFRVLFVQSCSRS